MFRTWFRVVKIWLAVVWWWFGANMAGQRNKNTFKFLLQLLILSQKHNLDVKKVVWGGLEVVCGGLEMVWGGWVFPQTLTGRIISQKNISFRG